MFELKGYYSNYSTRASKAVQMHRNTNDIRNIGNEQTFEKTENKLCTERGSEENNLPANDQTESAHW